MKRILALTLALLTVFALAACSDNTPNNSTPSTPSTPNTPSVMTHAEFVATPDKDQVTVQFYVQATQSWWDNKITVYGQDKNGGGYCAYEMVCSEADAARLVPGTQIRVTGAKLTWDGMHEVKDGTFEFVEGETWIAPIADVTNLLGTDDLAKEMFKHVTFKGLSITKIEFENGEPGSDIYVTANYNGTDYAFCVEKYLTGPSTDVYAAVSALQVGDMVDIEGFVYWWNNANNSHITGVTVLQDVG